MEILIVKNNHTIVNWESNLPFTKYETCIDNNKIEKLSTKLFKNSRMRKFTVTLLGLSLYCAKVFAKTSSIDTLGWTLLTLIRQWAKWILILWCIIDVIRSGCSGDAKKTLPILMKYIIIFASMYLIPEIFDAIAAAFAH